MEHDNGKTKLGSNLKTIQVPSIASSSQMGSSDEESDDQQDNIHHQDIPPTEQKSANSSNQNIGGNNDCTRAADSDDTKTTTFPKVGIEVNIVPSDEEPPKTSKLNFEKCKEGIRLYR